MNAATSIVAVDDLKVHFRVNRGRDWLRAVDGVSFAVESGGTLGVIGESGSGKSTLGRALVMLQSRTAGRMSLGGTDPDRLSPRELRRFRRDYQIIFQDPRAALDPRQTVLQSVREPMEIQRVGSAAERNEIGVAVLERVGLGASFRHRYPHELSGGQKQRVNIARALTVRPKLLVCDEVVAALDVSIQADILNLFNDLQDEFGLTYVFITHDLSVVAHVSDRIAVMYLGVFVELGSKAQLVDNPRHPYTRALLETAPQPLPSYMRGSRRQLLTGEIPSPVAPPSGCRFRTRCPIAEDVCAGEVPRWREVEPGHWVACHLVGEGL